MDIPYPIAPVRSLQGCVVFDKHKQLAAARAVFIIMHMTMHPERPITAGDEIITQGDPAMEAYLIMQGQFNVTLMQGGKTVTLATLGEGDIFGETAFFKGSDYGATVTAVTDGILQPITPDILDERIAKCDPLIRAVIRMLMIRLRKSNEKLAALS